MAVGRMKKISVKGLYRHTNLAILEVVEHSGSAVVVFAPND